MSRFVLDTSVAMAWCFEDESSPAAIEILDSLARGQAVVPARRLPSKQVLFLDFKVAAHLAQQTLSQLFLDSL